jgi:hypothetical protein
MSIWTTETWIPRVPDDVLATLTDPESIARWSPVEYELLELDGERLEAGSRAKVRGAFAGRPVEFAVDVHQADDGRLALLARGPVTIAAEYLLHPVRGGSRLRASVSVHGRGLIGSALAKAIDAVLCAGMLRVSVGRLRRELAAAGAE